MNEQQEQQIIALVGQMKAIFDGAGATQFAVNTTITPGGTHMSASWVSLDAAGKPKSRSFAQELPPA
jgi:hypothetical protein